MSWNNDERMSSVISAPFLRLAMSVVNRLNFKTGNLKPDDGGGEIRKQFSILIFFELSIAKM